MNNSPQEDKPKICPNQWVINSAEARQLIEQGATILDVRNPVAWLWGHVPGAIHISWQEFSQQQAPNKGKLLEDNRVLEEKLRVLGIFNDKPVIVIGNPADNFGEEGRIVWMLRTLGHRQAAFVNGGHDALVKVGVPIIWGLTHPQEAGDFVVRRTELWTIQRDELKKRLIEQKLTVIDTREPREYQGATPYGEQRGGHIPEAVNFYYKDLMDKEGKLLPSHEILDKLHQQGIQLDHSIIVYCTGGIRSAFFVAVLADLEFPNIKNYAGSMWEWSASSAEDYPLRKT